jgi:TRAP-type C4-dicarboxylate transport system permease small subunit
MKPSHYLETLHHVLVVIGGLFLAAMITLTCANIVLRTVGFPVQGTVELMGFFGAVVTACALGYTQIKRGHIAVDVLINTFSRSTRSFLHGINNVLCLSFFGLAAWQLLKKAEILRHSGEVTETLRIIYYPFMYVVAVGCVLLALVFGRDLKQALFPVRKREKVYLPYEEMVEEI